MAYLGFTIDKPDPADNYGDNQDIARQNLMALRDMVVMAGVEGWTLAPSGGTPPEYAIYLFSKGVERLRMTPTWSLGNITSALWEYSSDSGVGYDTIGTITYTYDGNGDLTAISGGASMLMGLFSSLPGRTKTISTDAAALVTRLTATRAGYLDDIPTIDGNIDTLLTRLTAARAANLDSVGGLDHVEHGAISMGGTTTEVDDTIASVVTTKSFLIFSNSANTTDDPSASFVRGKFFNSTTLRFNRAGHDNNSVNIEWQVVEFK